MNCSKLQTAGAAVERAERLGDDASPAAARIRRQQQEADSADRRAATVAIRAYTAEGWGCRQDEADRAAAPANGRGNVPSAVLAWQPAATTAAWQQQAVAASQHATSAGAD